MHKLYTSHGPHIPRDHPKFDVALEAERDMQMLGYVFDQFRTQLPTNEFRKRVRTAVKDSALPQQDRENSFGRDATFELFVAALCVSQGLSPVLWEEPDVTCLLNSVKYGVAAKRIKSANNLIKNVRKAIKQISDSKLPGIIVLETSIAFNPNNVRVTRQIDDAEFLPLYKDIVSHHWTKYDEESLALMRDTNVRGIIIHEQLVRFEPSGEWSLIGMTIHRAALHAEPQELRAFKSFAEVYENGLPNRLNLG